MAKAKLRVDQTLSDGIRTFKILATKKSGEGRVWVELEEVVSRDGDYASTSIEKPLSPRVKNSVQGIRGIRESRKGR